VRKHSSHPTRRGNRKAQGRVCGAQILELNGAAQQAREFIPRSGGSIGAGGLEGGANPLECLKPKRGGPGGAGPYRGLDERNRRFLVPAKARNRKAQGQLG